MSGLETLPPDQRAVLQLILVQGRSYAELAGLLQIDAAAVRARAQAGVETLGAAQAQAPEAAQRAQIADYLLGQQDEGERIVTLASIGDSPEACSWAQQLRERLAPLAQHPLPDVPTPSAGNGGAPKAPERPAAATAPRAMAPPPPSPSVPPSPASAPTAATREATTVGPTPPGASRRNGAILLAVVAALAIALVVVLVTRGGDDDGTPAASATTPTTTGTTSTSTTATAQPLAQVNLNATPAGGGAVAIGVVERTSAKQLVIAIQATKLPANGAQDIYAAWLQGSPGSKLLGFVPHQVTKAGGQFTVSASLPADAAGYGTVLITRESVRSGAVPTQPGETILSGSLSLS